MCRPMPVAPAFAPAGGWSRAKSAAPSSNVLCQLGHDERPAASRRATPRRGRGADQSGGILNVAGGPEDATSPRGKGRERLRGRFQEQVDAEPLLGMSDGDAHRERCRQRLGDARNDAGTVLVDDVAQPGAIFVSGDGLDGESANTRSSDAQGRGGRGEDVIVQCGVAKSAQRRGGEGKPPAKAEPSSLSAGAPKRKRGRPKGSKNKPRVDSTGRAASAVSRRAKDKPPSASTASADGLSQHGVGVPDDIADVALTNGNAEKVRNPLPPRGFVEVTAPNGLAETDTPDFMQELLPLLARQETIAHQNSSPQSEQVRAMLGSCRAQMESMHRSSGRYANLRPFRMREENEGICLTCEGTGFTVCDYCKGQGFVDLGENGEKFKVNFGVNELVLPKKVMGSIYHCPLCGGLREERCIACLGFPMKQKSGSAPVGAAGTANKERAWKSLDMDAVIAENADRIEIGVDGVIILRAKARKQRAKKVSAGKDTIKEKDVIFGKAPNVEPPAKRGRGRPRKGRSPDELYPIQRPISTGAEEYRTVGTDPVPHVSPSVRGKSKARRGGGSTDFVNTTDYQVGRQLRHQRTRSSSQASFGPDHENVGQDESSRLH